MIKAVLYDMDGTVLDTMPIYVKGWERADREFGFGGRAAGLIPHIAGMSAVDSGAYARSQLGENFDYTAFRKIVEEEFQAIIARDGLNCKKGAPEIFETVRKMGVRQILVTSSAPHAVFPLLERAGIKNAFDGVITGDMVAHSKPNPEIFLLGAKTAGVEPAECMVVEDAANGARAGIAAGMKTVMIPEYPPIPADVMAGLWHECRDLSELAGLIKEENKI